MADGPCRSKETQKADEPGGHAMAARSLWLRIDLCQRRVQRFELRPRPRLSHEEARVRIAGGVLSFRLAGGALGNTRPFCLVGLRLLRLRVGCGCVGGVPCAASSSCWLRL